MSERLRGAAEIISQVDYPNYMPDYRVTQEVSDALDLADEANGIRRIRFDEQLVESVRGVLARGAYQVLRGELPYEAQARAVVRALEAANV